MGKWPRMDRDLLQHVQRRAHRDHRLPVGRGADPAAAGPVRRGRAGRGRVAGHVRQGELLRRADGPRARDRDAGHQGPAAPGRDDRRPRRRDERPALHQARGQRTRTRRCCASSRARPWPTPTGSSSTATELLPEVRRGDAAHLGGASRRRATTRCSSRSSARWSSTPTANFMPNFPVPAGESEDSWFIKEVETGLQQRYPAAIPDGRPQAGRVRDRASSRSMGFSGLLPRGRRLHQLGQGPGHPRGPGPWLRGRARWRRTRWASPSSTRWSTA